MSVQRIPTRRISEWRVTRCDHSTPSCVGCGGKPKNLNRTCGQRSCIAVALHTSGLLREPTVACLDEWYKRSLIRQIVESGTIGRNTSTSLMRRLIVQYAEMR